ncbi:MAG: cytochrome c [Polyangiaceae bacterium]
MTRLAPAALVMALLACEPTGGAGTTGAATASAPSATPSTTVAASDGERATDQPQLRFSIEGRPIRSLPLGELKAKVEPVRFTAFDGYYHKPKTFEALELRAVLAVGFAGQDLDFAQQHYVLRATDGYTVPIDGKRLLEPGAYLAIDDLDTADGWEPLGRKAVDPGPFYLVWRGDAQQEIETYPRPYQLAEIAIESFDRTFPRTVPTGLGDDTPAGRGFALFREQCIRCHAINQQGGKVGPELNVPQSVVEYRDEALLRRYIRQPSQFRYGNMPDNPYLSDADLDGLIAYFRAMSQRKQDPKGEAAPKSGDAVEPKESAAP